MYSRTLGIADYVRITTPSGEVVNVTFADAEKIPNKYRRILISAPQQTKLLHVVGARQELFAKQGPDSESGQKGVGPPGQ